MYTQNNINAATRFGRFDQQLIGNGSILNVIFKVKMVVSKVVYFHDSWGHIPEVSTRSIRA